MSVRGALIVALAMLASSCSDDTGIAPGDAALPADAATPADAGGGTSERDAATSPEDAGSPLDALGSCEGGVVAALDLDRIEPIARETDLYRAPIEAARASLAAAIELVAQPRELALAAQHARDAGYVLCRGASAGDERSLVLLRPEASGSGHATLAIDTSPAARALILEAPHPLWDSGTADEAVAIFVRTHARAVLISGTHRCGSDRASGCDGTADACGAGAAVRESDMAHAVDSAFHAAHVALANAFPEALVVGVHGMGGEGASVSDGTSQPTTVDSAVARFARALHARFPAEPITTCNDFGDPDVPREARLCGTTDVQGRHLNGSLDACGARAVGASGRFLHLEQHADFRPERADAIADALIDALAP